MRSRPKPDCRRSVSSRELGLAANTVAGAYRELEAAGLVETRGRNGTFVVGTPTVAGKLQHARIRISICRAPPSSASTAEIRGPDPSFRRDLNPLQGAQLAPKRGDRAGDELDDGVRRAVA